VAPRVFITGATGFVGRHLTRLLRAQGYNVSGTCFPDKPCPEEPQIFHVDLKSGPALSEAMDRARPEWIIHLAALSNVRQSWEHRQEALETNLLGTSNLYETVRRWHPSARVLFISSSDVYGVLTPGEKYFREEAPFQAVNPYAYTKIAGELLSQFYVQVEKLDIILARPFPHTGPGQAADFVFSDWARQIALIEKGSSEPVIRVGNLDVRRDYSDVRDVVRAYVLLMQNGRTGEIYNVCSGQAVSLREVLDTLLAFSSKVIEVRQDPSKLRKTDIPFLGGDCTKLRGETGWKAEIPLERTLRDLVEYWRSQTLPT
jgi:GDP-4-dehydro-6-deoxy-D-mannose reductase